MVLTPPPQKKKKLFNKDSMEEIIPDGALKKESAYTGREVITDLRRIKRPPNERNRLFQPDNLDLIRFTIVPKLKSPRITPNR